MQLSDCEAAAKAIHAAKGELNRLMQEARKNGITVDLWTSVLSTEIYVEVRCSVELQGSAMKPATNP